MEKEITIPTNDGHLIYGTLNGDSDKLIIFVHGLVGHRNEHQFYNAAKFFPKNSYATFRFNLYSYEEKARNLSECGITTHVADVTTVLNNFRKDYKKIYLVGHSLGGPSIMLSNNELSDGIVLWDPTIDLSEIFNRPEFSHEAQSDQYIVNWGVKHIISKKMIQEQTITTEKIISGLKKPVRIIFAGDGILKPMWEKPQKLIKVKYDIVEIAGAGHCFDEEGTEEELFQATLEWIEKH